MPITSDKVILTIKDQVYQIIRKNILSGQLKPGDRINDVQIAKDLNVSRSPVRSAIDELIGEGLLESIPNKSVKVKQLTENQVLDIFEFRLLVEGYAIEKVTEHLNEQTKTELEEFRTRFADNWTYERLHEYVELDARFHNFLVENSGNQVVHEALHRVSLLITPFRVISLKSTKRFEDSIVEHISIIDAILDHDAPLAVNRCQSHLILAKNEISTYLRDLGKEGL
ncbi:MAG: GntR family transcriptional regulator [Sphaerochaetaceae bacterium]